MPYDNLIGRAEIIFFSIEEGTHAWELWAWPCERALGPDFHRWCDEAQEARARRARGAARLPLRRQGDARARAHPHDRGQPRIKGGGHYQRLEFLGDRVLGLAIAELLFREFPRANEGELSRRLSALVRKETCAEIAIELDLGAAHQARRQRGPSGRTRRSRRFSATSASR